MRGDGSAANQVNIITGCRAVWEEAAERRWQPLMATLATAAWPRQPTSHTHTLRRDTPTYYPSTLSVVLLDLLVFTKISLSVVTRQANLPTFMKGGYYHVNSILKLLYFCVR